MKTVKLLFMLAVSLLPLAVNADEIKLTEYITYIGEVDANNQPSGKGKLEVVCCRQPELKKDVLEGVFNNGVVTKAKLALEKHNGPIWRNSCVFKGMVEYTISGGYVTYKLTNGKIQDSRMRTLAIGNEPFMIYRIPSADKSTVDIGWYPGVPVPPVSGDTSVMEEVLAPTGFGEGGSCSRLNLFTIKDWVLTSKNAIVGSFSNGMKLYVDVADIRDGTCIFPNGDSFEYNTMSRKVTKFRKTFSDATVLPGRVVYSDGGIYAGTFDFGTEETFDFGTEETISNVFQTVMMAEASSEIKFKDGTLMRNGQTIKYTNGKTDEEIAQEQKEREERAAQEKLAEEKAQAEREKAQAELFAKYGVLDNEDGKKFKEVMANIANGHMENWAIAGHYLRNGIGVKANAKYAMECYEKAMNSEGRGPQAYGKMFMADLLWTGAPGVPKDQKKAFTIYSDLLNYTGWANYFQPYALIYQQYLAVMYYRLAELFETGGLGVPKNINAAIDGYRQCIEYYPSDNMYASAKYKLGHYIEIGRYRAIRNIYGQTVPNIKLAREYYQDAILHADAKTKRLIDQALQRVGY